jgi:Holliday junction resolvase RusA-like endonuclease
MQTWKEKVRKAAIDAWPADQVPLEGELSARIVYFYSIDGTNIADADNIIKPILDALGEVVFEDDRAIFEVTCRKSPLSALSVLTNAPPNLVQSLQAESDLVFVRICDGPKHEELPL